MKFNIFLKPPLFYFFLFADVTSLLNIMSLSAPMTQGANNTAAINMELSKISDWLAVNKLSLN